MLWADQIFIKKVTEKSPFELVYGMQCRLLIHLKIPMYQLLHSFTKNKDSLEEIINQLVQLDESRRYAFDKIVKEQALTKQTFDQSVVNREFKEVDLVLIWDMRGEKPGNDKKFQSL